TLFLLALKKRKPQLSTPGLSLTARRFASPASGSTLITSAPSHASSWVHEGPASYWVRSTMRIPSSALAMVGLLAQARGATRLRRGAQRGGLGGRPEPPM